MCAFQLTCMHFGLKCMIETLLLNSLVNSLEKEQDEQLERLKRERELRKKKAEEESLTLEQTKEAVARDVGFKLC